MSEERRAPPTVLPPTTTAEEDRAARESASQVALTREAAAVEFEKKAQGQRDINLIWEQTQMKVALSVVWASLAVSVSLGVFGKWLGAPDMQLAALVFVFGVANLVTGFYFGRTNHQKTGGVGGDTAGTR